MGKQTFSIVYVLFLIFPDSPLKCISGNNFFKQSIIYSFIDKTNLASCSMFLSAISRAFVIPTILWTDSVPALNPLS